jgi:hypothetical protein
MKRKLIRTADGGKERGGEEAILPVHIICLELQLDRLPVESVHVAGFGREDLGVLEFNEVILVEPMFRLRLFVWMSKP